MTTLKSRPTPSPSGSSDTTHGRASAGGYWLAAVIAVAGLLGAIVWAAVGAVGAVTGPDDLVRAALPADVTTQVAEPATLVVYYEGETVPSLTQLDVEVSGPGGARLPVSELGYDVEYDSPLRAGVVGTAMATFEAAEPGEYTISARYDPPAPAQLAVGENVAADFVQRMLGPALLAAGSLLLAFVIALSSLVRRAPRGLPPPTT